MARLTAFGRQSSTSISLEDDDEVPLSELTSSIWGFGCLRAVAVSDTAYVNDRYQMSRRYTSHHHRWHAIQESHGTTYVVLTLSLLIRPVWPSTCGEPVSQSQKKKRIQHYNAHVQGVASHIAILQLLADRCTHCCIFGLSLGRKPTLALSRAVGGFISVPPTIVMMRVGAFSLCFAFLASRGGSH